MESRASGQGFELRSRNKDRTRKCWACLGKGQVKSLRTMKSEPCPYCLNRMVDAEIDERKRR